MHCILGRLYLMKRIFIPELYFKSVFYFYSGNHSNCTGILCFNIFMPKICSGGQCTFIKVMSWPAAKSTCANTDCHFYLFSLGMQSQLQWIFFQIVFSIRILNSVTALWIMIWIFCCSTSPEINRIMLAKNLVLHSVKSYNSDSDFIMAFPEL